jgi:hypothetical protein
MCYPALMSDQGSDADQVEQRRDAPLLRRLQTTSPRSRAKTAEKVRRAKGKKPTRIRPGRASTEPPGS